MPRRLRRDRWVGAWLVGGALVACAACTSGSSPSACSASAAPDATFAAPFTIDTGVAPSTIADNYGQPSCPNQLLLEVDLTQAGFLNRGLFVSGRWSTSLPVSPCDERVTMTVTTFDGRAWQPWDVVTYAGEMQGSICHAQVQAHTNGSATALGGASIPAMPAFQKARVALVATRGSTSARLPVLVAGETL
jgi:hypothetical protein